MKQAKRERVYLLMSDGDGAIVGIVISEERLGEVVKNDWRLAIKKTDARRTLDPQNYPNAVTFYGAAIAEFQEMHPDWRIIFGNFIRVNTVGGRVRIGQRNIED
jgi:hypothetical protein